MLQMLDMAVLEVVDQDMEIVGIHQVAVDIQEEAPQMFGTLNKEEAGVHILKEATALKVHLRSQAAIQVCQRIQVLMAMDTPL